MNDRKILFITGASSDLGIEVIKRIHGNYDLLLTQYYSNNQQILKLRDSIGDKLQLFKADLSDKDSTTKMMCEIEEKGWYPDHYLHFAAPKFRVQKFLKESEFDFRLNYMVSVESAISVLKCILPQMIKQRYGKIVFALSQNVVGKPARFQSVYTVGKYALLGLMKSLSVEYTDKGITVNAVSPNMMDTKFLSEIPDLIVQQNAEWMPGKRNLSVEEVAPIFVFLLSDEADRITGENIVISGGSLN